MTEAFKTQVTQQTATIYLSKEEIEQIVAKGVADAFRELGIGIGPNSTVQEVNETRADLQFLRDWRKMCDMMKHKGVLTAIGSVTTALLFVLVLGAAAWIQRNF